MNQLDELTTDLTALLLEAQEVFIKMNLSVEAEILLVGIDDGKGALGFGHVKGEWVIHVDRTPIQHCSRAKRVAAAHRLNDLRDALLEAQKAWLANTSVAITAATKFLDFTRDTSLKTTT